MNFDEVRQFMSQHHECVIATISPDSQPEAATVGFSVDEDFKIMIATNKSTRKAKNIELNSKVAIVIGFDGPKTVQIEGEAKIVDEKEHKDRINLHFETVPRAIDFAGEEGQTYYLITPSWLRFTDYTKSPDIYETKDFS